MHYSVHKHVTDEDVLSAYKKYNTKTEAAIALNMHRNTFCSRLRKLKPDAFQKMYKVVFNNVSDEDILNAFHAHEKYVDAAQSLNISSKTFLYRLRKIDPSLTDSKSNESLHHDNFILREKVKQLEKDLASATKETIIADKIRETCFGLVAVNPTPPNWVIEIDKKMPKPIGIPSLIFSDFHWEEIVDPSQVDNLNEYNTGIAARRLRIVVESTIDLCHNHIRNSGYQGIVVPLLGDFLSGEIHLELLVTNELPVLPAFLDLYDNLIWAISTLADNFGNVFLPCVPGNHSRTTKKPHHKNYAFMNYDWLMYSLLERYFKDDSRVKFLVSAGQDVEYRIYNHTYRASHGAQFRGGDSIIGPLGPITRGDNKKRAWTSQVGMQYETSLYGHFHRLIMLPHVIVNGSLIGRNEFAHNNNYPFEFPVQALWMTHPTRGITISAPVQAEKIDMMNHNEWISWKES